MPQILIAEDDPLVRSALVACLERQGFDVAQARTGPETLERVREQSPDLLILDLLLPGYSGVEVLGRLREARLLSPRRVLVVSAAVGPLLEEALLQGAALLAKPFRLAQLRDRVGRLLAEA